MTDIQTFWSWFEDHAQDIHMHLEEDPEGYAVLIHEQLIQLHPDLVFDIPFEQVDECHELILSADGDASLFPLIDTIVTSAPIISNWIIHDLRPRTNQIDQAIDLDGLYLEYEDIFYSVEQEDIPLQLTIYIRNYDDQDNRYVHGFFLLLDTLLGERNAVVYTETIAIHPYRDDVDAKRFVTLRDLFDSLNKKKS